MQREPTSADGARWLEALVQPGNGLAAFLVAQGTVTAANAAAEELFGGPIVGARAPGLFAATDPEKVRRALTTAESGGWELIVSRPGEEPLPLHFTVLVGPAALRAFVAPARREPHADLAAPLVAMNAELANLSRELSRRNRQLERARARSDMLRSITAALAAASDLEQVLAIAVERAVGALGAADGAIFLLEPDGRTLRGVAEAQPKGRKGALRDLDTLPHARRAVESGDVALFAREEAQGEEGPIMDALGLTAVVPAPLVHAGACLGVLYMSWAGVAPGAGAEELAQAKTVAAQCALAIAKAQLLHSEREARVRAERAEVGALEAVRTQEELTAIVGHDLRTPLSAIEMSAELLLRRGGLGDAQREAVRRIKASARRMASLVTDLLAFSQARQGLAVVSRRTPTDLGALCRATLNEFLDAQPGAPIALHVAEGATAQMDAPRMAQAVSNLVGNALQHGGGAGVDVTVRPDDGHVLVSVHNGGAPIPPAVLPHIFEPFRRGPQASDGAGGSMGLGLYIVKVVVEGHGGSVEVASDAASGTTFTMRIPREVP